MLSFMEKHPDLGLYRMSGPNAKQEGSKLWETLKEELNCEVGPKKTTSQWQNTWSDWKVSVKRKWREIVKHQNKTGGGPPTTKYLHSIEKKLLSFLSNSTVDGGGVTPEADSEILGIPSDITVMESCTAVISPASEKELELPPRKKINLCEDEILNNQKQQLNEYKNIQCKLDTINETLETKNDILETISKSLILQNQLLEKLINKTQ